MGKKMNVTKRHRQAPEPPAYSPTPSNRAERRALAKKQRRENK